MASCIFAYSMMLRTMDGSDLVMTAEQAQIFFTFTLKHLQCYSWLHSFGMQAALRVPGRRCWLLMPKHHHLWHIAHEVFKTWVNPKKVMLLSAESFVGVIGRIARATHRSTVSQRTLERYLVQVHLKLKTKLG